MACSAARIVARVPWHGWDHVLGVEASAERFLAHTFGR